MIKQYALYTIIVITFLGLWLIIAMTQEDLMEEQSQRVPKPSKGQLNQVFSIDLAARYDNVVLVDPEQAPEEIRGEVMKGYWILMNTPRYAEQYVGDRLSCRNCHFNAGNTLGGKNGSVSLVGVSELFPKYSPRVGREIDLADRINMCFERSMNGRALPKESSEMKAIVAYLEWISSGIKGRKDFSEKVFPEKIFPWLGLPEMTSKVNPDLAAGEKQYELYCSECHQKDGSGTFYPKDEEILDVPPLWGEDSFNDGASMSKLKTIAPFIWLNMPYRDPELSEQEAVNIGQYIITRPRPKFKEP